MRYRPSASAYTPNDLHGKATFHTLCQEARERTRNHRLAPDSSQTGNRQARQVTSLSDVIPHSVRSVKTLDIHSLHSAYCLWTTSYSIKRNS